MTNVSCLNKNAIVEVVAVRFEYVSRKKWNNAVSEKEAKIK